MKPIFKLVLVLSLLPTFAFAETPGPTAGARVVLSPSFGKVVGPNGGTGSYANLGAYFQLPTAPNVFLGLDAGYTAYFPGSKNIFLQNAAGPHVLATIFYRVDHSERLKFQLGLSAGLMFFNEQTASNIAWIGLFRPGLEFSLGPTVSLLGELNVGMYGWAIFPLEGIFVPSLGFRFFL